MNFLNDREIDLHISILGWLHIVANATFLILAVVAFFLLPTIGVFVGDPDILAVLSAVATGFAILMFVLALPGLLAGYGLLTAKPWARILALVLGILNLLNFPFGTLMGIYTLAVLLQDSAGDHFHQRQLA